MWDEADGFYYDVLRVPDGTATPLKVRSMVGLPPICAATVVKPEQREKMTTMLSKRWAVHHYPVSKPIDGQPAMPMAARRSKTRPGCARGPPARSASLTFTIPTATNCVRFIACRRPELSQIQN